MYAANWHAMRGFSRDSSVTRQRIKPGTVRRIATYARPYRRELAIYLAMTVLAAVATVAVPLLLKSIINGILARSMTVVLSVSAIAVGIALGSALLAIGQRWFSARIGEGLIYDLRTEVFGHVQRQPIAFFTRAQTGSLVSRLNSDVIGAQSAITSTLSSVVSNAVTLILVLAVMFSLSWLVTVVSLVLLPVFVIPARMVGRRLQRYTRESMQLDAELGSTMTERFNVAGAMLVKLFGNPERENVLYAGRAARVRDIGVVTAMYGGTLFIALSLLASMATAVIYGLGGALVIHARVPARHAGRPDCAAATAVRPDHRAVQRAGRRDDRAGQLRPGVRGAGPEAADRGEARRGAAAGGRRPAGWTAGQRASGSRPGHRVRPGLLPLPDRERGVAGLAGVDRAARARAGRAHPAGTARVTFHAPPGQLTALVGPSGAGKTTDHPPGVPDV